MRPINRVGVALIVAAAALAGTAGLSRTMALGPYHHHPQEHDPDLGARASALDGLDASLERALDSPLPPLPRLVQGRPAPARPRPAGSRRPRGTASPRRAFRGAIRPGSRVATAPPARRSPTRTPVAPRPAATPAAAAPVTAPPPAAAPSRTDAGAGSRRRPAAPPRPSSAPRPSRTPQPAPGAGPATPTSPGGADHEGQ